MHLVPPDRNRQQRALRIAALRRRVPRAPRVHPVRKAVRRVRQDLAVRVVQVDKVLRVLMVAQVALVEPVVLEGLPAPADNPVRVVPEAVLLVRLVPAVPVEPVAQAVLHVQG